MIENFKINSKEIDKIKKISKTERDFRINNLNLFNEKGFPNKKQEDWKFSDLREIIQKNFNKLKVNKVNSKVKKFNSDELFKIVALGLGRPNICLNN